MRKPCNPLAGTENERKVRRFTLKKESVFLEIAPWFNENFKKSSKTAPVRKSKLAELRPLKEKTEPKAIKEQEFS